MAAGAELLAKLDGWSLDSISESFHGGDVTRTCNYPVQILIGNEAPLYCNFNILGLINVGQFLGGCDMK